MKSKPLQNMNLQIFTIPRGTTNARASKTCFRGRCIATAAVLATLSLTACNDQTKIKQDSAREARHTGIISTMDHDATGADESLAPRRATGLADLDFGEDWAEAADARTAAADNPIRAGVDPSGSEFWAIVLSTFSGENHEQAAANMVGQLGGVDASLTSGSRVHTKDVGSYVIYGRFGSPQSPEAKSALQRIRGIKIGGNAVFPRAMFTRITIPVDPARLHPHDLRQARLPHPDAYPLYSMEVAVWVAEGDTERALHDAQRRAEADAARLRAQGFEAYFYHDGTKRVSSITIGRFFHEDWDAQANLESSRVTRVRQSFPVRLMNGEQVDEVLIHNKATGKPMKTIPVVPRLVLVPELD